MIYGYARVSTRKQAKDGNSLEDQEAKLRESGAAEVYKEFYTGTKLDRPAFDELMRVLKPGDTLMVTKLDRFARTTPEATRLIRELTERGIKVHVLNMGVADNTPMGKLMVTILFAFAEYERDMIVERTSTGKDVCRERGTLVEGRPRKESELFSEVYDAYSRGGCSVKEACATLGISRGTWYNRVREVSYGTT